MASTARGKEGSKSSSSMSASTEMKWGDWRSWPRIVVDALVEFKIRAMKSRDTTRVVVNENELAEAMWDGKLSDFIKSFGDRSGVLWVSFGARSGVVRLSCGLVRGSFGKMFTKNYEKSIF